MITELTGTHAIQIGFVYHYLLSCGYHYLCWKASIPRGLRRSISDSSRCRAERGTIRTPRTVVGVATTTRHSRHRPLPWQRTWQPTPATTLTPCSWSQLHIVTDTITIVIIIIIIASIDALTLLVGRQEGHPACKNWVVRYWRGYLSAARCKWFVYGPADATATPSSLAPAKSRMVYLSGAGLPRLSWKKGR